jgi:hypothetical protein
MRIHTALGLILCSTAFADDRVDELFGDGVFGVTWQMTLDDIRTLYPDGKLSPHSLSVAPMYEIQDSRTVLEIERHKRAKISFLFYESGTLMGISVDFPNCPELTGKLLSILGPPQSLPPKNLRGHFLGAMGFGQWHSDSVSVSTQSMGLDCSLMIAPNTVPLRESVDKSALGL